MLATMHCKPLAKCCGQIYISTVWHQDVWAMNIPYVFYTVFWYSVCNNTVYWWLRNLHALCEQCSSCHHKSYTYGMT